MIQCRDEFARNLSFYFHAITPKWSGQNVIRMLPSFFFQQYVYTTPCAMTTVVSTDSSEQFNEAAINTNTQV